MFLPFLNLSSMPPPRTLSLTLLQLLKGPVAYDVLVFARQATVSEVFNVSAINRVLWHFCVI